MEKNWDSWVYERLCASAYGTLLANGPENGTWEALFESCIRWKCETLLEQDLLALSVSSHTDASFERVSLVLENLSKRQALIHSSVRLELDRCEAALSVQRIPFIQTGLFQLAELLYPNPAIRSAGFGEISVPSLKLEDALKVLGRLGFRVISETGNGLDLMRTSGQGLGLKIRLRNALLASDSEPLKEETWDKAICSPENRFHFQLPIEDVFAYWLSANQPPGRERLLENPVYLLDLCRILIAYGELDWERVVWILGNRDLLGSAWLVSEILNRDWLAGTSKLIPPQVVSLFANSVKRLARKPLLKLSMKPELWVYPRTSAATGSRAAAWLQTHSHLIFKRQSAFPRIPAPKRKRRENEIFEKEEEHQRRDEGENYAKACK
jgi:hypothetical protein